MNYRRQQIIEAKLAAERARVARQRETDRETLARMMRSGGPRLPDGGSLAAIALGLLFIGCLFAILASTF